MSALFLIAASSSCGSGLDARGRREPLASLVIVAALQTALSALFLIAASRSCGGGLDARERREPLAPFLIQANEKASRSRLIDWLNAKC